MTDKEQIIGKIEGEFFKFEKLLNYTDNEDLSDNIWLSDWNSFRMKVKSLLQELESSLSENKDGQVTISEKRFCPLNPPSEKSEGDFKILGE